MFRVSMSRGERVWLATIGKDELITNEGKQGSKLSTTHFPGKHCAEGSPEAELKLQMRTRLSEGWTVQESQVSESAKATPGLTGIFLEQTAAPTADQLVLIDAFARFLPGVSIESDDTGLLLRASDKQLRVHAHKPKPIGSFPLGCVLSALALYLKHLGIAEVSVQSAVADQVLDVGDVPTFLRDRDAELPALWSPAFEHFGLLPRERPFATARSSRCSVIRLS